jgi:hypothetical protein
MLNLKGTLVKLKQMYATMTAAVPYEAIQVSLFSSLYL